MAAMFLLAAALLTVAGFALTGGSDRQVAQQQPADSRTGTLSGQSVGQAAASANSLDTAITKAQQRLQRVPGDWSTWGQLGLAYVQQAKITVNPMYYGKAKGVIGRSLSINSKDNYIADTAMASLLAAEHNFAPALDWAQRAAAINGYSSAVFGVKADALTQLGRYDEAAQAVQRELDLQPGTPAFARASYVSELKGDIPRARALLDLALQDAETPADKAFAYYYLGQLAFNAGDPKGALGQYNAGLAADPTYSALLEGKAQAEGALGQQQDALRDWAKVVSAVPQPQYVREYGEYLQSLGRDKEAKTQYDLFAVEEKLFEANGVQLELEPALFNADHGQPKLALTYAESGITRRPFLEVYDALAWAYYRNGRYDEALAAERKAMAEGMRNALFSFHLGMIEKALGQGEAARKDLSTAMAINPYFSPLFSPVAKDALTQLGGPI